jgi:hypothetical protein
MLLVSRSVKLRLTLRGGHRCESNWEVRRIFEPKRKEVIKGYKKSSLRVILSGLGDQECWGGRGMQQEYLSSFVMSN